MCFGSKPKQAETPAAAPAQPDAAAVPQDIGLARKIEDQGVYGTKGQPKFRTDRTQIGGGATAGGSGLQMM